MIARVETNPLDQLRGLSRNSNHPFQRTALDEFDSMRAALSRFHVGALVTTGETGTASAAMDLGARMYIPLTGFAPRGKFNETGALKPHHAPLLLEPSEKFSTLTSEEARAESQRYAPYARRLAIEEAEELNARHSCAVVVMSPGELVARLHIDVDRLKILGNRFDTFVCDLSADPSLQGAQLRDFLSMRKPLLLNITGPRESLAEACNYSVYERVNAIISGAFSDQRNS